MPRLPDTWKRWLGIGLATVGMAIAFGAIGVPSPSLFAALAVGVVYALMLSEHVTLGMPDLGMTGAQAAIGVTLGTSVDASTLSAVGGAWLPVLLVTVATLALSLLSGLAMAHVTGLDAPTASLGLVAGGASGIVAMADELGADGRLVAFMQYLRVLIVVLTAPVLAHLLLHTSGAGSAAADAAGAGIGADLLFTVGCMAVGLALARVSRLAAGALLAPLIVAAGLSIAGVTGQAEVPDLVQQAAFAVIGLQVGLRFTMSTLRQVGRLLPATLVSILVLLGACAGLAALLVPTAHVSYGDAYLATTPGGVYAVLAAVASIGGNVTFVVAVQAMRILAMVLAAPVIVRLLAQVRPTAVVGD